ncbi:MAG: hypothetical protein K2Y39_04875 [Candidatus Obscuribacterales bacterium]|nr:hypothetical protein [Candidatus Obscuribacterales bacterium]
MNSPLIVTSPTLAEVWQIYKQFRKLKPLTVIDYEKKLRLILDVMNTPIDSLTKQYLFLVHARISERNGLTTAGYVIRIVSALLEFSIQALETPDGLPVLITNPARVIRATRSNRKPSDVAQACGIKHSDLANWIAAVQRHPQSSICDWLVFMLLTGARRTEATDLMVADVRGNEVKLGGRVVPMSDACATIVHRRLSTARFSTHVFPGKSNGKISDWNKTSLFISREAQIQFTPYQLRLTYKEIAIAAGLPDSHINRLMRGSEVSVSEQLRKSQQAITDEVQRLINPNRICLNIGGL